MSLPEASGSPVSVLQGWQRLNQSTAISKASEALSGNLPTMHQPAISLGYDVCMETNTTTTNLPTKVADFARFLDRNEIPYTLKSEVSDCLEHSTFWTFTSVEGRWFEASVHTMFLTKEKHTTNYGKTKRATQSFCSAWATGITVNSRTKTLRDAEILWTVYAPTGGN
jgi:hypothetical protein